MSEPCLCGDPCCRRCFPGYKEPNVDVVKAADHLLDMAISRHGNGDEVFFECQACGEWDGHEESCFVPLLKKWMEGE